ncbi:MAG: glycosyltransferase family 87 protein [Flavobacteriales bacterium]
MKRGVPHFLWLLLAGGTALLAYGPSRSQSIPLLAGFAGVFLLYLLVVFAAPVTRSRLIILAMGLRALLFLAPITWTDDHVRYLWDGTCSVEGISPFAFTPDELLVAKPEVYNAEWYAKLNSPHFYSVYPPVAQTAFWGAAAVGRGDLWRATLALRLLVMAAELLTLLALAALLKGGKQEHLLALYALNPLVLMEFTVNLHTEAFALPACLWALVLLRREKLFSTAGALSVAAAVKLWPILFLAWLPVKSGWKKALMPIALAGVFFSLSWLPLWTNKLVPHLLSSLELYANYLELNGPLFEGLRFFLGDAAVKGTGLLPMIMLLSLSALFACAWWKRRISFADFMLWTSSIFLFCGQVVHPWYVVPLLAFGLASNWYWPVAWTLLIMPTYLTYGHEPFTQPYWWMPVEYGMLAAVIVWEWRFAPWRKAKHALTLDGTIRQQ